MDMDQQTLLFRVRKTVLQMLKDRGYIVSEKKLNQTKQEFAETYNGSRESLNALVEKRASEDDGTLGESSKLIVFFPDAEKLNKKDLA